MKASSVVELFRGHPERWTQRATARRWDGAATEPDDPRAVSFCMVGACQHVHGIGQAGEAILRIREVCGCAANVFNNTHTFEEVLAVIEAAAV